MSDIFGKEAHDYQHLEAARRNGMLAEQLAAQSRATGLPPHDFRALGSGGRTGARFESAAQAFGFATNNLLAIQAQIIEIMYLESRYEECVPIIRNVPDGAKSYAYRVLDRVGRGRFIDNDGNTAPSANVATRLVSYPLDYAGIIAEWTIEDIRHAMFAGVPLESETVQAAGRGAMNHIEDVAFTGDDDRGWKGLTNLASASAPTGDQVKKTSASAGNNFIESNVDTDANTAKIHKLFLDRINDLMVDSAEIFGRTVRAGMTIFLPVAQYNLITSTPFGDNRDKSVWEFTAANNGWTNYTGSMPMLYPLQELEGASDTASKDDRMIIAIKDSRVYEMALPIEPRVITILNKGYTVCAPLEYKMSGLNVKLPAGIKYIDGI